MTKKQNKEKILSRNKIANEKRKQRKSKDIRETRGKKEIVKKKTNMKKETRKTKNKEKLRKMKKEHKNVRRNKPRKSLKKGKKKKKSQIFVGIEINFEKSQMIQKFLTGIHLSNKLFHNEKEIHENKGKQEIKMKDDVSLDLDEGWSFISFSNELFSKIRYVMF